MQALKNESRRGFALLVCLLIIAVLTAMVGEFMFSTKLHAELMSNHRNRVKARYLARSAINAYQYLLELNQINPGQMLYGTSNWLGYGSGIENLEGADIMSAMLGLDDSILAPDKSGPLKGQWSIPLPGRTFDLDGAVHGRIVNERGKINLNATVQANSRDRTQDVQNPIVYNQLRTLMQLRGVDDEDINICLDSLVDWIDQNNGVEPYGAEEDYYRSLPNYPYYARNDFMVSIDEMLLVQGCTVELYERIKDFVTVHPRRSMATNALPDHRIDPNVAPKMVLMAIFLAVRPAGSDTPINDPDTASQVADDIYQKALEKASLNVTVSPNREVQVRMGNALTLQDVNSLIKGRLQGNFQAQFYFRRGTTDAQYYTAIGAGEVNGVTSVIEAVLKHARNKVEILQWKEE